MDFGRRRYPLTQMSAITDQTIRAFVLAELVDPLDEAGIDPATAPDDLDLIETGLVDSFGLLEILTAVEAEFDLEVDYEAIDPDELTRLGPLCAFVAAQA